MHGKFNLGEGEHFVELRKVRRESMAIFNLCPSERTDFSGELKGKQAESRSERPTRQDGEEPRDQGSNRFLEFPSLDDTTFTISVIEGPSKGLAYQLNKLCITVGRIGGAADFEFDEPEASDVHCIVAVRQSAVRLYDAASRAGIYVNDQRVPTVELKHMSTFRIGTSLLLISILASQRTDNG